MRLEHTRRPRRSATPGFTLVELLVVIAIISLLLAIAIPSLSRARQQARAVAMKATLRAIDTGLEQFQLDYNRYPASERADAMTKDGPDSGTGAANSDDADFGAQLLVQALLGWDLLGYVDKRDAGTESGKDWYNLDQNNNNKPYRPRKGLYVEPEALTLKRAELTESRDGVYDQANENNVIVDNNGRNTPVLYFQANRNGTKIATDQTRGSNPNAIFYMDDNAYFLDPDTSPSTGSLSKEQGEESLNDGLEQFMWTLLNPKTTPCLEETQGTPCTPKDAVTNEPAARPFNRQRFVLWAAGLDGFYGTDDDIFNFEK